MISIIFGFAAGYGFGQFIGGEKEGVKGRVHWEWFLRKTRLHIHHWIIFLFLLLINIIMYDVANQIYEKRMSRSQSVILGFFIGGLIHGLTYDDWYKIIHAPTPIN